MSILVSFCVPTYNGMAYLPELVESLLSQIDHQAEIILCDDRSTDGTFAYAQKLAREHPRIKAFQNPANLGMDRNFHQAVKHAQGTYVWLAGQDDIFGPKAYATFLNIVAEHLDLDMAYFNYRQLFQVPERHYGITYLQLEEDRFFRDSHAYFSVLDHAPSFLPATVMRRCFWEKTDVSLFYDTIYVQVGCWLSNCKNANVYVVADPTHVDCRCPPESWKGGKDPQMAFDTRTGKMEVYYTVLRDYPDAFPRIVYTRMHDSFLFSWPLGYIKLRARGLKIGTIQKRRMKKLFCEMPFFYYFSMLPLLLMPIPLARIVMRIYDNSMGGRNFLRLARKVFSPFK